MEMGRPHGLFSTVQDPGCVENRQSKEKLTIEGAQAQRKRGRAMTSGEQKEKKSHMPPKKIPGRAGGGGGRLCLAGSKYPDMALPV